MAWLPCSYLGGDVELTDERERHIAEHHSDLLPAHYDKLRETLADPDQVWRSDRYANALLFLRWYTDLHGGRFVVVVVITEERPSSRKWIVTSYIARRPSGGTVEWSRN